MNVLNNILVVLYIKSQGEYHNAEENLTGAGIISVIVGPHNKNKNLFSFEQQIEVLIKIKHSKNLKEQNWPYDF